VNLQYLPNLHPNFPLQSPHLRLLNWQ